MKKKRLISKKFEVVAVTDSGGYPRGKVTVTLLGEECLLSRRELEALVIARATEILNFEKDEEVSLMIIR
jgi:hypothetical protein